MPVQRMRVQKIKVDKGEFYMVKDEKNNAAENVSKVSINWYPGHMAKTKRLISENIKLIDIVFEVIDARIPYSSKIKDIEPLIKNKPKVLIFNKYDLCDNKETDKWVKHYQNLGYQVITTSLINNIDINNLLRITNKITKNINDERAKKGLKGRSVRILVVGIPNVGKSTLINKLVKRKAAGVGNKPGVTKGLSWIKLSGQLEMLDTPGILWPKFEEEIVALNLATFTAIKEEVLPMEKVALYILQTLSNLYSNKLAERYQIEKFDIEDVENIIDQLQSFRKVKTPEDVYNLIINDVKSGNLKNITFDRIEDEDK